MISLSTSTHEIQRIKKSIEERIKHKFMSTVIDKPIIDEDKLFILSELVPKNPALSQTKRDIYIITTMLVQVALDTHELVTENTEDESKGEKLVKQLHVLAGDYYSGLYYYLLSQIDDFTFIHKLATAIKAINEYKMQLYYGEYENMSEYIELKVEIESLLFESVADYFNQHQFIDSFKQWIYVSILLKEKETILKDEILLNSMLNTKQINSYLTLEEKFGYIIHQEWSAFQDSIMDLPSSVADIQSYFNDKRISLIYMNSSNVEEG